MNRLLLSRALVVSAFAPLLACGALSASTEGVDGSGTAGRDGGAREGGNSTGDAPGSVSTSRCALTIDGVRVTDAPAVATPSAILMGTKLLIQCGYQTMPRGWGSLTVYVDGVTGPGTYEGYNAYYGAYDGTNTPTGYSSHEPQSDVNHPCSVVIDTFAPREKGGMTARFSCPTLVGNKDQVSAAGSVALPPRAGNDAGAPPDASGLNEAGEPSCILHAHGAYAADAVGYGDNYSCMTYASDGTSFSVSPGSTMGYLGIGAAWCPTCGIDYTGGSCTFDVEVDQGVGGRYAASFACTGLVGGDGTMESVAGRIDGIHHRPPE